MLNKIAISFVVIGYFLTVSSIAGTIFTPADCFYEKHPDLKQKYIALYPTSYKERIDSLMSDYSSKMDIIQRIKRNFPDIVEIPGLIQYLDGLKELEAEIANQKIEEYEKRSKDMTKDDYLYYFKYEDDKVIETGLLVLNNGDIKFREVDILVDK